MRVLVIEDDRKVASFIQTGLEQEGYAVDVLNDGVIAADQARAIDYDAVVLDLMLPGRSGFQVLRDVRAVKASLPVLILTARASLEERVAGLDAGADDYMAKPFALAELSARLRALLRRGAPRETVLRVADLEVDTIRRTVRRGGAAIDLRPKEYALLEFLLRHADRPVTKTLIIEHVWDIHFDSVSNVVEVHINALRNKIDRNFGPPLIHTVRGVGYMRRAAHVTLPLRLRLTVASTAVFGVLLAGFGVTTYRLLATQLEQDASDRLSELSQGLHGYLRLAGDTVSLAFDADDSDQARFVHQATQYYRVYDADTGRLLAESSGMTPLGLAWTSSEARALGDRTTPFDVTTGYGRFRLVNSRLTESDGRVYLLQVGISLVEVDATLRRYRSLLLWPMPAALVMAAAASWWFSRFALGPLARVAAAARSIDVGALDRRVPVRGAGDELDHVAGAFNQTIERLAGAVGDMRQFSSALAHELRTPLAALRGQVELTWRRADTSSAQRESFASQIEEIDRLTRLIDRVLTLARAESGQVQLSFSAVNLADLAGSLVEQLRPMAEARAIELGSSRLEPVVVDGDAGWLERLFLNLLDNALKYTAANGHIEVRVSRSGDEARIEVTDTGIGLSPKDVPHVFEKFFRADRARSSESTGAGLGLSLVRWIAEQHGGTAAVESRLG